MNTVQAGPDTCANVAAVLERLLSVVRRLPAPGQLSLPTASALNTLHRYGPARLTDLARGESVSQPAMTQLVSRLERDGLAHRRPDRDDGRVVLVEISAAGAELVAARRAARAEQIAVLWRDLDPADTVALDHALPALTHLAELGEVAGSVRTVLGPGHPAPAPPRSEGPQ